MVYDMAIASTWRVYTDEWKVMVRDYDKSIETHILL